MLPRPFRQPAGRARATHALGFGLLLTFSSSIGQTYFIALFGLRLFGQGMSSHLAMTFVARWFVRERGRALGLAFLGYPAGEAVFPMLMALLLGQFTWRWIWVGIAIAVVLSTCCLWRLDWRCWESMIPSQRPPGSWP